MGWVRDGEIMEDDGQHGDDQVDKAASVRFVNPDLPHARVTIYAYAEAPERIAYGCDHNPGENGYPEEHVGCSWDLDNLRVMASIWFEIDESRWLDDADPDWSDIRYEMLDTRPYSPDVAGVKSATSDALSWIKSYDPNKLIGWDGERF